MGIKLTQLRSLRCSTSLSNVHVNLKITADGTHLMSKIRG